MAKITHVWPDDDDPFLSAEFVASFPILPKPKPSSGAADMKEHYDQRVEDDPTFLQPKRPKRSA